jgi:hypothetical protein
VESPSSGRNVLEEVSKQRYSWTRAAATMSLAGALLVTIGCGLSNGKTAKNDPPATTTYAYVSGGTEGGIAQFQVTSDGTLAPLSPATIAPPTPYGLGFLTVDPSSQFLFAIGIVSNPMVTNQIPDWLRRHTHSELDTHRQRREQHKSLHFRAQRAISRNSGHIQQDRKHLQPEFLGHLGTD